MATVAIGPILRFPSWQWIGADMAKELSKKFRVVFFDSKNLPECDAAIIVKRKINSAAFRQWIRNDIKLIYMPIDVYENEHELRDDASFLSSCSTVLIHSERMRHYLDPIAKDIRWFDHHNKYSLTHTPPYRRDGYILWIGEYKYVPYLLKWAGERTLPFELKILTNYRNGPPLSRIAAAALAKQIGVTLTTRGDRLNGHKIYEWSVETQRDMMNAAKAAVDIKGGPEDFNQFMKPPAKAQKFVASGLPFATNAASYAIEYFADRGFSLATVDQLDRWFSEEYWRETSQQASQLRHELSVEVTGAKLAHYVECVLAGEAAETAPRHRIDSLISHANVEDYPSP